MHKWAEDPSRAVGPPAPPPGKAVPVQALQCDLRQDIKPLWPFLVFACTKGTQRCSPLTIVVDLIGALLTPLNPSRCKRLLGTHGKQHVYAWHMQGIYSGHRACGRSGLDPHCTCSYHLPPSREPCSSGLPRSVSREHLQSACQDPWCRWNQVLNGGFSWEGGDKPICLEVLLIRTAGSGSRKAGFSSLPGSGR